MTASKKGGESSRTFWLSYEAYRVLYYFQLRQDVQRDESVALTVASHLKYDYSFNELDRHASHTSLRMSSIHMLLRLVRAFSANFASRMLYGSPASWRNSSKPLTSKKMEVPEASDSRRMGLMRTLSDSPNRRTLSAFDSATLNLTRS